MIPMECPEELAWLPIRAAKGLGRLGGNRYPSDTGLPKNQEAAAVSEGLRDSLRRSGGRNSSRFPAGF